MDLSAISSLDVGGTLLSGRAAEARARTEGGDHAAAASEFEALLGTLLVKELRRTLPSGFFGGSSGADTYDGWLDDVLGRKLAESGALDLAGMVKVSLDAKARGGATEESAR